MPRRKQGPHPLQDKRVAVFVRDLASGGWEERRPGIVTRISCLYNSTWAVVEDRTGNEMSYNIGLSRVRLIPDPEGEANGN